MFYLQNQQSWQTRIRRDEALLVPSDLQKLQERIREAVGQEWPQVGGLLIGTSEMEIRELGWRAANAVAPVASDGGEVGLTFHPMNLSFIRIADSDGQVHVQDVIALSGGPPALREVLRREPAAELARRIGVDDLCEASSFLNEIRGDQWPLLMKLAWEPVRGQRLVIRDGLLRTLSLTREAVQKMATAFQQAHAENGALLVGVAKRSQLLNYISLALQLQGTFRRSYPCFAAVPRSLEQAAYPGHNWLGGHGFGQLHLAKLASDPDGLVLMVDLPHWLADRRKQALEYLADTARGSFPLVGYPYPLVQAHERASLGKFDVSVIVDMLVRSVLAGRSPEEAERILRHVTLGRGLAGGGAHGK